MYHNNKYKKLIVNKINDIFNEYDNEIFETKCTNENRSLDDIKDYDDPDLKITFLKDIATFDKFYFYRLTS